MLLIPLQITSTINQIIAKYFVYFQNEIKFHSNSLASAKFFTQFACINFQLINSQLQFAVLMLIYIPHALIIIESPIRFDDQIIRLVVFASVTRLGTFTFNFWVIRATHDTALKRETVFASFHHCVTFFSLTIWRWSFLRMAFNFFIRIVWFDGQFFVGIKTLNKFSLYLLRIWIVFYRWIEWVRELYINIV